MEDREEARADSMGAASSALSKMQWLFYVKFLLDLVRLAGAILIVFGALHLCADPVGGGSLRVFAVVCGGLALLSILWGGFMAMLG
jgi:hypothetical protein